MAIYMKYAALKGEVTAEGYKDWMEVSSLQWGVGRGLSMMGSGGLSKREATAPSVSEMSFTKTMDSISPLLLKEALGGKAEKVEIHLTQTDNNGVHICFQKYVLENTLVSGYSVKSSGDRPAESFSLNFTKIESRYNAIDAEFKTTSSGSLIFDIALSKITG